MFLLYFSTPKYFIFVKWDKESNITTEIHTYTCIHTYFFFSLFLFSFSFLPSFFWHFSRLALNWLCSRRYLWAPNPQLPPPECWGYWCAPQSPHFCTSLNAQGSNTEHIYLVVQLSPLPVQSSHLLCWHSLPITFPSWNLSHLPLFHLWDWVH